MSIEKAVTHFNIKGKLLQIEPIDTGHINQTFRSLWISPEDIQIYFLHQKVNHHVFPDVPSLMRNMQKVTAHLAAKADYPGRPEQALSIVPSDQGELYWKSPAGEFWRTLEWIPECETFEVCPDDAHAYSAGAAFGSFLRDLSELPNGTLVDPIPFFQNVPRRLTALRLAVAQNVQGRQASAEKLIEFIESRIATINLIENALSRQVVPERIVHADPKMSNVLFRKGTSRVAAIVDLDTCMMGTSLYEVGDMLRSAGVTCAEDEEDLSKVNVTLPVTTQLLKGYLTPTREILTEGELKLLPRAPQVIALSLGMRFLTDYLEGDRYFRIHYEDQNLRRAKTQFAIAERFEGCEGELCSVIREVEKAR